MTTARRRAASEIAADGIGKAFGSFEALRDITLTVGRGEFLTLLGPSGSGKTTFLMILAGFEAPTSGRLSLDGADMTHMPAERRAFGMVFQGYALFPHMSVEENIAFPLRVQRRSGAEIARRTAEMVEMVGLGGHQRKRPAALSGGQQQRVALARALAYEPSALLLDEPFSALDKNLRGQMQDEVRRLHRETGTTFVFVTHDQSEALALSDRVAIFDAGRLAQVARPQEVYERPANRFVAEFLGDINILPLTDLRPDGAGASGSFSDCRLRAPGDGGTGHLAVRPEAMRLSLARPEEGNGVPALVEDLIYQGAATRLALRAGARAGASGVALSLTLPTADLPASLEPGQEVWVAWPEDRGVFV